MTADCGTYLQWSLCQPDHKWLKITLCVFSLASKGSAASVHLQPPPRWAHWNIASAAGGRAHPASAGIDSALKQHWRTGGKSLT